MVDLGLDVLGSGGTVRTRGRAKAPVGIAQTRELTGADLALLQSERGIKPQSVVRIRDSHHALARCLAKGMRPGEASAVTGYSASRISILQADPSFQELLALYKDRADESFSDFTDRMATVAMDALAVIHERIVDDPDKVDTDTLLDVVKVTADRTGHGPQTKSTNVNVNVDLAGRLDAARKRAGMIDITPETTP